MLRKSFSPLLRSQHSQPISPAHTDRNWTTWAIGFHCHRAELPSHTRSTRQISLNIPPHGLDCCDMETRTMIRAANNSMILFQPEHLHGTTPGYRMEQLSLNIVNSCHVLEAYRAAMASDGMKREQEAPSYEYSDLYDA